MTKQLSDLQLTILANAAERGDGVVLPVPKTIKAKGGALTNVLNAMVKRGLIEEVPGEPDETKWRRDENGQRLSLRITHSGLSAIGIEPERLDQEGATDQTDKKSLKQEPPVTPFREGSKGAAVTQLLQQDDGASIDELMSASGWQAHSVRGFLSGTLKKKHSITVLSERTDGERRYRIAG